MEEQIWKRTGIFWDEKDGPLGTADWRQLLPTCTEAGEAAGSIWFQELEAAGIMERCHWKAGSLTAHANCTCIKKSGGLISP